MKKTIQFSLLFFSAILFQACNLNSGHDYEIRKIHSFNFEMDVLDESGNISTTIVHDSSVDIPNENSFAIFGNDFIPDEIKENMIEDGNWDPDFFYQNEILLHIDESDEDGNKFSSFHFMLPEETGFTTDKFSFIGLSEKCFTYNLKNSWEFAQDMREIGPNSTPSDNHSCWEYLEEPQNDASTKYAIARFAQKGVVSEKIYDNTFKEDSYLVVTESGFLEILNVFEDQIKGKFEVNIWTVPVNDFLFQDEFPDDIQLDYLTIKGTFTASYGDWQDMIELPDNPIYHYNK